MILVPGAAVAAAAAATTEESLTRDGGATVVVPPVADIFIQCISSYCYWTTVGETVEVNMKA